MCLLRSDPIPRPSVPMDFFFVLARSPSIRPQARLKPRTWKDRPGRCWLNYVVKATVFLQSMADFPKVNALYDEAFSGHKPARSTVQVAALPLGALVEIEVTVELP
jgi:hypothetical protein